MRRKHLVLLVALALLATMAAGCAQTAKEAEQPAPAKPQTETIIVGSDTTFAPLEFADAKGNYVGFDVDLINAIGEEANLKIDFRSMPFDGLIAALTANQIDAAISSMSITEERKKSIDFSEPYYKSGLSIAVQSSRTDIDSLEDLQGKIIAVQSGTTGEAEARKVPGATVRSFTNSDQTFMELKNGGADAVINDYPVTAYFIAQGNPDIKIVGERLTSEDYGIAVPKGRTELLQKINQALRTLKQNGTYTELYVKWFGEQPPQELLQ
ncbi:MAG: basic amino acid ABC transporter substrate-binding protein [Syntrophomonadaceae bacterium]|jgi:polar amino acid transport system substrate-binding protein|nr:basic amino acid ABC transporter substrate-binding protein [Syntrophomonadaceae bacterium]